LVDRSGVCVHTAAVGAKIIGPRIGRDGPDGKPRAIPGLSIAYVITGCFILLVGS